MIKLFRVAKIYILLQVRIFKLNKKLKKFGSNFRYRSIEGYLIAFPLDKKNGK